MNINVSLLRRLNQSGFDHVFGGILCFVAVGLIGSFLLVTSHAATVQWKGTLRAYSNNSKYCLTAAAGTTGSTVALDPCGTAYNAKQVWSLSDVKTATIDTVSGVQEFELQSAAGSNECLDNWGASKKASYPEKLYTCSTSDTAVTWSWSAKLAKTTYTTHQLMNLGSSSTSSTRMGLCLDDKNGSDKSGAAVGLYTCKTTKQSPANQEWFEDSAPSSGGGSTSGALFSDNFTGTSLGSAWDVISRHGEYAQNETECNTANMVSVANDTLTITTEAKTVTCGDFNLNGTVRHQPTSWPYDTGDIQWKSLNFTYGTVTVRAKFPPQDTDTWPAIWMLGSNCQATNPLTADVGYSTCPNIETTNYEEIDNVECFMTTWCQTAMSQPGKWAACTYNTPVDDNWHTYKLVWTKTSVASYVDGKSTGCDYTSADGYVIPSKPMFLIIQTQTGGAGGTPDNSNLPTSFQISNVTVTQP